MKPTLVVMAAGIGSRYGGLKQIDAVGKHGEGIIDFSVFDALRADFGKVVFVIRRDIEKDFRQIIGQKHERKLPVAYAFQELADIPEGYRVPPNRTKPWGTAHAVLAAESLVETPFAVINGDDFYGLDAYETIGSYLASLDLSAKTFAMVGYRLRNTLSDYGTVSRGVCRIDEEGFLVKVVERLKIEKHGTGARVFEQDEQVESLTGDETVSMNMFGFTPAVFPVLRQRFAVFLDNYMTDTKAEFLLPAEVDYLVQERIAKVKVLTSSAQWFGITHRPDKDHVVSSLRSLVEQGHYPEQLN